MPELRNLLQLGARALRGPCPACGSPRRAPLCSACCAHSRVADEPRRGALGAHELRFVGAYHAVAPSRRDLSPLGSSLRAFKDHADRYAGRCLSRLFAARCAPLVRPHHVIVPVPPDLARLRERGFSPAAWLARCLAGRSGARLERSALRRLPGRPPQRGLDGVRRRENARGAFEGGGCDLRGRTVALVDDVVTTGATLRDAARCLRAAGAHDVLCAVLACADEEMMRDVDR